MAAAQNSNNLTKWKDGEPTNYLSNTSITVTGVALNNLTLWKDGEPLNFQAPSNTGQQQADFFLSLGI